MRPYPERMKGWEVGSVAKSPFFSCRGPRFGHHLHWKTSLSVNSVPGEPTPSSGFRRHLTCTRYIHVYVDKHFTHKSLKKKTITDLWPPHTLTPLWRHLYTYTHTYTYHPKIKFPVQRFFFLPSTEPPPLLLNQCEQRMVHWAVYSKKAPYHPVTLQVCVCWQDCNYEQSLQGLIHGTYLPYTWC